MADHVTESIIVKGNVSEIYNLWADFVNFPRFMKYIEEVKPIGPNRTHWEMKGPLNTTFEWDAETTRMEPNSRIAWQSIDGNLKTSGQVTFKQLSNRQTEITVTMHYEPPAGVAGEVGAALFANPEKRLTEDLRNFKAMAEGNPTLMSSNH